MGEELDLQPHFPQGLDMTIDVSDLQHSRASYLLTCRSQPPDGA
jgi:hypothetical protein